MKLLMKAMTKQSSSASGKSGKAGKSVRAPMVQESALDAGEEDDEAEDDFEPDRSVDPGPPPASSKPRFFDALARGASKLFDKKSARVRPGTALHVVH